MPPPEYEIICMGRSSIDLYSSDIGAPFPEITSFDAFVGGCPTNVCVGAQRLGARTALLTAVGEDPVGDFLERFLRTEGVETEFVRRKPGTRTSAVLLGIEPPDRFPLVYYRNGCADIELNIDDVLDTPIDRAGALLISGTGLSREPSRSATMLAARKARTAGTTVYLDLDFRADQWHDVRAFGVVIASVLPWIDVVLGTEEEVKAAALADQLDVSISHSQISAPTVGGDIEQAVRTLLAGGSETLVLKRGADGARIFLPDGQTMDVAAFSIEVVNLLGAGDAFAAGLMVARQQGCDWREAVRLANANGAIVVTRSGCANFMPTREEVTTFIRAQEKA